MVLRLHVWGPAFGLASIDAECLATITYLAYAVPTHEWELVATSPSAVPTHILPSLEDTASKTWTTGFRPITTHLSALNPDYNLDRDLNPSQRADSTAYTAHLTTTALPLLALSLYVSSANWAAATRPAYSALLPLPLPWTEPIIVRRRMSSLAAHLGLEDLNIDAAAEQRDDANTGGFLRVPERLRPRPAGVRAALAPEQTALFRLQAAAADCLAPLADLLKAQRGRRFFFGAGAKDMPTSLDCLAFGYLALMLLPAVPRAWLRDVLKARYEGLCVFVDGVRDEVFGGDDGGHDGALPWTIEGDKDAPSRPWTVSRFVGGVVEAVVPERWISGEEDGGRDGALGAVLSSVAGLGLVGGVLLYRHLSPFGSALYRWEMQRRSFGAAGTLFGL